MAKRKASAKDATPPNPKRGRASKAGKASPKTTAPSVLPASVTKKLDTPGVYPGISMLAYHGDLCSGPSVSASTLALMDEQESCPAKAWARYHGNPDQDEDDGDTPAKAFGTATHLMILEGEERFFSEYVMKPRDMNFSTKDGIAWKAANPGRKIITEADLDTIRAMHKALLANPDTNRCFTGGQPEVTAVIKDKETGLWLKTRPDYLRPSLALNYKTARNSARWLWPSEAWRRGHHVSAAVCVDVLATLGRTVNYCFVVQEKTPPYLASLRVLDDVFLSAGRMVYRNALRRFAECLARNDWPGYPGVETVKLPAFADRQLADMVNA